MGAIVAFETISQLFYRVADHYEGKNRPALTYKDRKSKEWTDITWEEFRRRVEAFAAFLKAQGVRKGDRVAILSENRPEWAITDIATQVIGAVNVSLYTSLPSSQVAFILKDSGSRVFVVSTSIQLKKAEEVFENCPDLERVVTMSELRKDRADYVMQWDEAMEEGEALVREKPDELRQGAENIVPNDLSALIYTSGTTGNPKGVMLTHENFCSNVRAALQCVPFGAEDIHLSFLPLCHSFERTAGYTAVLSCGARITYAESIDTVSRNLLEVSPTVMISVPRLFEKIFNVVAKSVEEGSAVKKRIFDWSVAIGRKHAEARHSGGPGAVLRAQYGLAHRLVFAKLHQKLGGNLRFAVSGGAALPRRIGEFFEGAGITIIEGYGLTETAPVLTINPHDRPRYGTVGQVIPGVTIAIQRTSDGKILGQLRGDDYPSNLSTGEGEIIARGPNIMRGYWNNEQATKEAVDPEGWYHTGDIGRFEGGYLLITDRIKHMIVSAGGKNIYPGPIEDQFKTVQWIDQILVVGEGREYLTALVVPNFEALEQSAHDQNLSFESHEDLIGKEEIKAIYEREFRSYSRSAASHEKIRDFRLLSEPFSVDNGLLTPTMKPRRRQIEASYAPVIDEMYEGVV
jgi:long-chain acyl-CoA synthetase